MRSELSHGPTIGELIAWAGASTGLSRRAQSLPIGAMVTDSRKIARGDIFVALTTERDDGHRYVSSALKAGAAAAVVARSKVRTVAETCAGRLIVVRDTLEALQRMAAAYRASLGIPFVGITGSTGKTTARNLVSATLSARFRVGWTEGNLNNHLGVPRTILAMPRDTEIGVVEMGANHAGEIHTLSMIARPCFGVITNVGYAHIGNFGTLDGTLAAKWEITDGMDPGGWLVLNGDDSRLVKMSRTTSLGVILAGFSARCDVRATDVEVTGNLHTTFLVGRDRYELAIPGRHFVACALPAIALAGHLGISAAEIAGALAGFRAPSLRGGIETRAGIRFIVDCYNANPSSMKSALALLRDVAGRGRAVAIVGDMLELGIHAKRLHREFGRRLAGESIGAILVVGEFARTVADAAVRAGMNARRVHTAQCSDRAVDAARSLLRKGDTVLLKASRGIHLETLYERLF